MLFELSLRTRYY